MTCRLYTITGMRRKRKTKNNRKYMKMQNLSCIWEIHSRGGFYGCVDTSGNV